MFAWRVSAYGSTLLHQPMPQPMACHAPQAALVAELHAAQSSCAALTAQVADVQQQLATAQASQQEAIAALAAQQAVQAAAEQRWQQDAAAWGVQKEELSSMVATLQKVCGAASVT